MANRKLYFVLVIVRILFSQSKAYPSDQLKPETIFADSDIRIVGGENAEEGQFPWQVSIRDFEDEHFCGGSIINSEWILTAAHCVVYQVPSDMIVVVGSVSLSKGGDRHQVSKIISHADFDYSTLVNDVALLKLASEIEFSQRAQAIPLETENLGVVNCVASGFGTTAFLGPVPDILQFVNLKTISVSECKLRLRWADQPITNDHICTLTKSGEGACHGDSGGPLVADGKLIGIVSWGNPCAIESPDVFTRVSSYVDWIGGEIGDAF